MARRVCQARRLDGGRRVDLWSPSRSVAGVFQWPPSVVFHDGRRSTPMDSRRPTGTDDIMACRRARGCLLRDRKTTSPNSSVTVALGHGSDAHSRLPSDRLSSKAKLRIACRIDRQRPARNATPIRFQEPYSRLTDRRYRKDCALQNWNEQTASSDITPFSLVA